MSSRSAALFAAPLILINGGISQNFYAQRAPTWGIHSPFSLTKSTTWRLRIGT